MIGNRGFTLIELLVVIGIIAILAAIILVPMQGIRQKALNTRARADVRIIRQAVDFLTNDSLEWPGHNAVGVVFNASANEIYDLNVATAGITSTDGAYSNWKGPYMSVVPRDPWGRPYFFDPDYDLNRGVGSPAWGVVIGSFGPIQQANDTYDADDIVEVLAE